jgi:DNA primase catalytic core, N-terminal domain
MAMLNESNLLAMKAKAAKFRTHHVGTKLNEAELHEFEALAEDRALLLEVVDYYGKTLKQSPEAMKYLEGRGLMSSEIIDRFKLGFANRTLGYGLEAKNRAGGAAVRGRLQRLGVLRDSGHEHFNGSLVIPVLTLAGDVVEIYGRKITRMTALRARTEHLAAADAVVRTQSHPRRKRSRAAERRQIASHLAEQGMRGEGVDARDFGQIDPEDAVQMFPQIELQFIAARLLAVFCAGRQPPRATFGGGRKLLQHLLDLDIAGGHLLLVVAIGHHRLAEREQVLTTVVPHQRLRDGRFGCLDARITHSRGRQPAGQSAPPGRAVAFPQPVMVGTVLPQDASQARRAQGHHRRGT